VPDDEYITVAQASQLSGLSRRQLSWLLKNGVIEGIKPGHDWLVRPSVVMEYLARDRRPGPKPRKPRELGS
jgi:excisionase family DNA binding protein